MIMMMPMILMMLMVVLVMLVTMTLNVNFNALLNPLNLVLFEDRCKANLSRCFLTFA